MGRRLYQVDEHYFDCIDSEEKAYWLGFITADGSIDADSLNLHLKRTDKGHLEKAKLSMGSKHLIRHRKFKTRWARKDGSLGEAWYVTCVLKISSVHMVRALAQLGVTSAKSHIVRPCAQVSSQLLRHYWRGVFDGDGCITKERRRKRRDKWRVSLIGNRFMVGAFASFIKAAGVRTRAIPHQGHGQTREWATGGIGVCAPIVRLLYERATIALDRKAHLAMLVMQTPQVYKARHNGPRMPSAELHRLRRQEGSWEKVAQRLNVTVSTVYHWRIKGRKLQVVDT